MHGPEVFLSILMQKKMQVTHLRAFKTHWEDIH